MICAVCCTKNWYVYLRTEIYALFKHNNVDKLYLFIEDDEIPYLKDTRIEFINVNKLPEYILSSSPNYNTKYSKMSYIRCYFTKVLNCDKIIYIDADAIVVDNIEELWKLDVDTIAGVKEGGEWSKHLGIEGMDDKYINSGVLVMNLKNIRQRRLDDEMINLLNTKFYHFPDQDVINIVFKDKMYLSNIYNSTETTGFRDDAKIIHYIRERKGWIKESPRSEIWFKYQNEMLGEIKMIKAEVLKEFTLGRFNELKNIKRANASNNEKGRLYKDDMFECEEGLAKYLTGDNAYKDVFIKVIEIVPEVKEEPKEELKEEVKQEPIKEEIIEKPKKKKTRKSKYEF